MSLRLLQINLHHNKAASAALLLRLTEGGADLVLIQKRWVLGGKVAGLGTKEYRLMLDHKEGKIRTCILAKRNLSIFLLRNYSNVISCDANAHHTQWGCPNSNDRGKSLFDFILNSNLFLCNRGNVPTFITKASKRS